MNRRLFMFLCPLFMAFICSEAVGQDKGNACKETKRVELYGKIVKWSVCEQGEIQQRCFESGARFSRERKCYVYSLSSESVCYLYFTKYANKSHKCAATAVKCFDFDSEGVFDQCMSGTPE